MRIRRVYLSSDGREFSTRQDAVCYENNARISANYRERMRRSQERKQEKQRIAKEKREEIENSLAMVLRDALGTDTLVINTIIQNRRAIKQILARRI